jgi:hypothetical protein
VHHHHHPDVRKDALFTHPVSCLWPAGTPQRLSAAEHHG